MGIYYEYFTAATDDEAAAVVHRTGPASRDVLVEPVGEPRRNWLGLRKRPEPTWVEDPSLPLYDTVSLKFFSPDPDLASIEAHVTGRPDEDLGAHEYVQFIASADEDQTLVMALTDRTRDVLAATDAAALTAAAQEYCRDHELRDDADAADLAEDLVDLSALAGRAREARLHLYCFVAA